MSAEILKLRADDREPVKNSDMEDMLGHALGRAQADLLDGVLVVQVLKSGAIVTTWTFDQTKMPAALIYALEKLKHDLLASAT